MSLYLQHRPLTFNQVIGNSEIIETLENMVQDKETCPHTFLFHGPTGCGKTTLGRIVASELGCVGADLAEIDSADFRGIDTIRDIRRNTGFAPMEGSCRVWILDECHKLTNDAQNALLKVLEDTPKHVYFILCTTEPNRLIPTVRGRCSQFQVKQLTDDQMMSLLRKTVKAENESLQKTVYEQIIQDALGHPRNALQVLDQVLRVDEDKRLETAKRYAEEMSESIELCRALLSASGWKQISGILNGLKDQDAENIRRHVLGYCQAVLLKSDNEKAGLVMDFFVEPFYNSGFPGLVHACYSIVKN